MTHDETEKRVGEQELAAFQLHEELDERRDRNDVINHLAMWIYGQWRRSLPKTRVSHCDLRMICTMPLDILYEIFEHLHPIDLYHISRTNRSFQDILRSPSSNSIWWTAYERENEIPRCPPRYFGASVGGFVVWEADLSSGLGEVRMKYATGSRSSRLIRVHLNQRLTRQIPRRRTG